MMENNMQQHVWKGIDLEALRQVTDKPADEAVTAVFESKSMDYLRTLLVELAQNDSSVSDQFPKPMHDFVKSELGFTFTAEDVELFKQTHEIWKEKGIKFIFILFFRALPYTYMAEKPANVLKTTKLLITQPERRIFETAQFVFDVMDENWWEPDKRGILTALKVRIMHAAMRHVILHNKGGQKWNEALGQPISQEDLVATNQVFSLEFFKGMTMLSDALSQEEQKAWFHTWKTIGRIMGVQDDLICSDVKEAWTLQHAVYDHLFHDKTVAGIPLAKALVETMITFHLPARLTLFMMRKMLADEQYPDCFDRMLGPSYQEQFPDLFAKPFTEKEKKDHKMSIHKDFHNDLKEFHGTLVRKVKAYKRNKTKKRFLPKIGDWMLSILGRIGKRTDLFEIHISMLKKILDHEGIDALVDEFDEQLQEDFVTKTMASLGGIMVSILSVHFREGKQAGFRIPTSLKEHWSLT
jgi:hypothetical protein